MISALGMSGRAWAAVEAATTEAPSAAGSARGPRGHLRRPPRGGSGSPRGRGHGAMQNCPTISARHRSRPTARRL